MPDEDDSEDLADLLQERARLQERLRLLAARHEELIALQATARTQEAIASRLGISRDEVRKLERIALLKLRRVALQLHPEIQA